MIQLFPCAFSQSEEEPDSMYYVQLKEVLARVEERMKNLEELAAKPKDHFSNVQIGLSFGFNAYANGPKSYYIQPDSTMGAYGTTRGVTGMLSALIGYKVHPRHTLYLNVPLSDLTNGPSQTIGIFNKKVAGGLGYGYNMGRVSLIAVVNVYPYEDLAYEILKEKKYEQEPYTTVTQENLPTITQISPSVTLGLCYNFIKARDLFRSGSYP